MISDALTQLLRNIKQDVDNNYNNNYNNTYTNNISHLNITETEVLDMLNLIIIPLRQNALRVELMWVFRVCLPTLMCNVVFYLIKAYQTDRFRCSKRQERLVTFPVMFALTLVNYLVFKGWNDMLHELFIWSQQKIKYCIEEHEATAAAAAAGVSVSDGSSISSINELIWLDKCNYDATVNIAVMTLIYIMWFAALLILTLVTSFCIISFITFLDQIIHSVWLKIQLIKLFGVFKFCIRCFGGFHLAILIHYIILLVHTISLGSWGIPWFNISLFGLTLNNQPIVDMCTSILTLKEVEQTLAHDHCSYLISAKKEEFFLVNFFFLYFIVACAYTIFYIDNMHVNITTTVNQWQQATREEIVAVEFTGLSGTNKDYNNGRLPSEIQGLMSEFSESTESCDGEDGEKESRDKD